MFPPQNLRLWIDLMHFTFRTLHPTQANWKILSLLENDAIYQLKVDDNVSITKGGYQENSSLQYGMILGDIYEKHA